MKEWLRRADNIEDNDPVAISLLVTGDIAKESEGEMLLDDAALELHTSLFISYEPEVSDGWTLLPRVVGQGQLTRDGLLLLQRTRSNLLSKTEYDAAA